MPTRRIRPIILCTIAAAVGCNRAAPSSTSAPAGRPLGSVVAGSTDDGTVSGDGTPNSRADDVEVDRTPRVSYDPREIAEVRKQCEQDRADLYADAFKEIRGSGILVPRYGKALESQRARAVADLKRMLADPAEKDATRARAARALIELGDPAGEDFLLAAVRDGRGARRASALKELDEWIIRRKVDLSTPDRARLMLDALDDPDPQVVLAAAGLCAARNLNGTEAKLIAVIRSGRIKEPGKLILKLARVARSHEAAAIIRDELLRESTEGYDPWSEFILKPLIENPDPKFSEPIRTAYLRRTLRHMKKERPEQWVIRGLALAADRSTLPVLEDVFAHSRDPVCREYAVEAMARFDPEHALDRALELVRAENRLDAASGPLERLASPRTADRIVDAFLEIRKRERRRIPLVEARLLLEHLGPRGRRALEESIDDLEPHARTWAIWNLKGLTVDTAIDDLRAAGIIKKRREEILRSMQRSVDSGLAPSQGPLDHSDPSLLWGALSWADVLTSFDMETDEIPCEHHRLIMEFAEGSDGVFRPECAVQTWHRKNDEDIRAPYTVRFIHGGRLYRFGAENHGDWYDVEAVVPALNFALANAGRRERFIGVETSGQDGTYVFADPSAFRPIAEKYSLPISKDPGAAERHGKEYERQVIDQLKSRQEP